MSSEPIKVLPMAQLLRLSREKEERERHEREVAAQAGVPSETISQPTRPVETIVSQAILQQSIVNQSRTNKAIVQRTILVEQGAAVDELKGYYASYNDISDRLIPQLKLNPFEQAVLQRLYRLSRGWKSEECEVGLGTLAKFCVMSKSQIQRSIGSLVEKGLIVNLGESKKGAREGNRYHVLPGLSAIPSQTIPRTSIPKQDTTVASQNIEVSQTIPGETTNKNSNKDFKNTHTNDGVRVGSKFTIEDCRKYAQHLQSSGQGINNPGGYATTIHRTGEADLLIAAFLHPETPPSSSAPDVSQCPDCNGTGFYYPKGSEGGVAKCKHTSLQKETEP